MDSQNLLSELKYKEMPEVPDEVIRYAKEKVNNPASEMKDGFWRRDDLAIWLNNISKWRAECLSNYIWLRRLYEKHKNETEAVRIHEYIKKYETERDWTRHGLSFIKDLAGHTLIK